MTEETFAHTPIRKMFELEDVYGIRYDEERSTRRKVRIGIIGAGGVAQSKHIPAINRLRTIWEPVELAAVSVRNELQGRKLAEMYGCKWYPDYKVMIEDGQLDGVIVCSPDVLHFEHALACLQANIPTLVEKPLTLLLSDGRQLCKYADDHNVLLMTVSNKRYSAPYQWAKKFVEHGPVSDPALFTGKFNLGYDYVNLLEDGTIHMFDLARYFMGDVSSVYAIGVYKYGRLKQPYPADNIVSTLSFSSDAVGVISTSSSALSLKPWERVEIYANHAWLAVEDQYEVLLYDSEQGPTKSWRPVIPNTLVFDEELGGFMGLIENFAQCIRGAEKPIVTGWDGYKAYELAVATHLSIKHDEQVKLPLDPVAADQELREWFRTLQPQPGSQD